MSATSRQRHILLFHSISERDTKGFSKDQSVTLQHTAQQSVRLFSNDKTSIDVWQPTAQCIKFSANNDCLKGTFLASARLPESFPDPHAMTNSKHCYFEAQGDDFSKGEYEGPR